jgi:hypothetical protein
VQVWSTLFAFAKEVLNTASTPSARDQCYPVLRCLTVLAKIVSVTSALEDRRLRRDLQDVYAKLLDLVITSAPRLSESATWVRRDILDADHPNGFAKEVDGVKRIFEYLATSILPNLRNFLTDNDRVTAVCNTISTNYIVPAFRKPVIDATCLHVVEELSKIPGAAKAWRIQVGDAFNDAEFFRLSHVEVVGWKPLICSLMDSDRERFGELLGTCPASDVISR